MMSRTDGSMTDTEASNFGLGAMALLQRADLQALIDVLAGRGYSILGPTVRNGTVVYEEVGTIEDLPIGLRDAQGGGHYRLEPRGDAALFGYTNGVQSWRRHLFPPRRQIWRAERTDNGFTIHAETTDPQKVALLGVRPCEIRAIEIQDKVFIHSHYVDPEYAAGRENAFIIAVNCGSAGDTCFCVSMGTGPRADHGFDLALTELLDLSGTRFLSRWGVRRASRWRARCRFGPRTRATGGRPSRSSPVRPRSMGRRLETEGLKELLQGNVEHPRWREVAERCLACGNCTLVCPTCFCFAIDDVTDLRTLVS